MKFQRSDILASKMQNSQVRHQNSCISSPFQSRHPKPVQQGEQFRVFTYKTESQICKQKVHSRCNIAIEYIPEFSLLSQTPHGITIKIKQYTMELLPWLIKKEPLFKVNIVLGIYVAFLQLVDVYGIFPLHPNMMKVSQREEVAVWINKNFEALQPDQVLTKNAFSTREFMKSFLRIFRCCLPNKSTSEMYNDSKQLLNDLVKIKRKQQMHKNCHQFLKHNNQLGSSRKFNNFQSISIIQNSKLIPKVQRYSTKPIFEQNQTQSKSNARFSSFSPPKRNQRVKTSLDKFNQTSDFKHKPHASFGGNFLKKKDSRMHTQNTDTNKTQTHKQTSICSNGQLFKRYLMFSTSKYQQMTKVQNPNPLFTSNYQDRFPKDFIFRSQVYKQNQSAFSQMIIEERNSVQVMSQQLLGIDDEKFSSVKLRKMSSNTNQRPKDLQAPKRFMNSTGWKKSFKEQDNFFFAPAEQEESAKNEPKQKLKNSFPYKTASTITSFRLSNQHQHHIFPSKSEQNLNVWALQSNVSTLQKEKDKKIQEMKIVEQNELENDFNNIFSMENSNLNSEDEKKMETIITEFQQVLF